MNRTKQLCIVFFLSLTLVFCSGCSLLQIPGKIIDGTFGLLGQVLKIIQKMPKPPPWVF